MFPFAWTRNINLINCEAFDYKIILKVGSGWKWLKAIYGDLGGSRISDQNCFGIVLRKFWVYCWNISGIILKKVTLFTDDPPFSKKGSNEIRGNNAEAT